MARTTRGLGKKDESGNVIDTHQEPWRTDRGAEQTQEGFQKAEAVWKVLDRKASSQQVQGKQSTGMTIE